MKNRVKITLGAQVQACARRAAEKKTSLVDEMLGSAKMRTVKSGRDPLFEALRKRWLKKYLRP